MTEPANAMDSGGLTCADVRLLGRCFIVPPHMLEAVELRGDEEQRAMAASMLEEDARFRNNRAVATAATAPRAVPTVAQAGAPANLVYDAEHGTTLPGTLVRDSDNPSRDEVVDDAWNHAADTARLYREVLQRDSLDGHGMAMVSTVHYGRNYNNAFWNGEQMVYGDGDGVLFTGFAKSRSVVGHEFSHGVVQFSGGHARSRYEDRGPGQRRSDRDPDGRGRGHRHAGRGAGPAGRAPPQPAAPGQGRRQ